jgi:ferrochelatase
MSSTAGEAELLGAARPEAARLGADALLLVSFGGPEGPDDVLPFLRNVTRGRDVPEARLAEVAAHYHRFGGRSPINDQNRALLAALRAELAPLPVYWGNRNWAPYLKDALARMTADGVRRAACFVTSAFASYSGCRQYREDLAQASAAVGPNAPELVKLRPFFDHPGFVEPMAERIREALGRLDPSEAARAHLVFVAHSLPLAQARAAGPDGGAYERQLHWLARAVTRRVSGGGKDGFVMDGAGDAGARGRGEGGRTRPFSVAYSSRSGPPSVPWLTPDVGDQLDALAGVGVRTVVVVPAGFVSDHMEVVYDLDVEAADRGRAAGLTIVRAATVGTDPRFVSMVGQLMAERAGAAAGRAAAAGGSAHAVCPLHCCEPPAGRPAAAGTPADPARSPQPAGRGGGAGGLGRTGDVRAVRRGTGRRTDEG